MMKNNNANHVKSFHKAKKEKKFLYSCPRCYEPIHEDDILYIHESRCYCFECRRPPLFDTKSFNIVVVQKTPSENRLLGAIKRGNLI